MQILPSNQWFFSGNQWGFAREQMNINLGRKVLDCVVRWSISSPVPNSIAILFWGRQNLFSSIWISCILSDNCGRDLLSYPCSPHSIFDLAKLYCHLILHVLSTLTSTQIDVNTGSYPLHSDKEKSSPHLPIQTRLEDSFDITTVRPEFYSFLSVGSQICGLTLSCWPSLGTGCSYLL